MPKNIYTPGAFVRITLADGSYGYGRVREFPYAVFYDLHTTDPLSDLEEIATKPILFTIAVHKSILNSWEIIGQKQLDEQLRRGFERFTQSLTNPEDCKIVDEVGHERPAKPIECVGLERVAVWEATHVEDRLLDTFMKRPNKWVDSMKVKLP